MGASESRDFNPKQAQKENQKIITPSSSIIGIETDTSSFLSQLKIHKENDDTYVVSHRLSSPSTTGDRGSVFPVASSSRDIQSDGPKMKPLVNSPRTRTNLDLKEKSCEGKLMQSVPLWTSPSKEIQSDDPKMKLKRRMFNTQSNFDLKEKSCEDKLVMKSVPSTASTSQEIQSNDPKMKLQRKLFNTQNNFDLKEKSCEAKLVMKSVPSTASTSQEIQSDDPKMKLYINASNTQSNLDLREKSCEDKVVPESETFYFKPMTQEKMNWIMNGVIKISEGEFSCLLCQVSGLCNALYIQKHIGGRIHRKNYDSLKPPRFGFTPQEEAVMMRGNLFIIKGIGANCNLCGVLGLNVYDAFVHTTSLKHIRIETNKYGPQGRTMLNTMTLVVDGDKECFFCSSCDERFSDEDAFDHSFIHDGHIDGVVRSTENLYECEYCSLFIDDVRRVKRHLVFHKHAINVIRYRALLDSSASDAGEKYKKRVRKPRQRRAFTQKNEEGKKQRNRSCSQDSKKKITPTTNEGPKENSSKRDNGESENELDLKAGNAYSAKSVPECSGDLLNQKNMDSASSGKSASKCFDVLNQNSTISPAGNPGSRKIVLNSFEAAIFKSHGILLVDDRYFLCMVCRETLDTRMDVMMHIDEYTHTVKKIEHENQD